MIKVGSGEKTLNNTTYDIVNVTFNSTDEKPTDIYQLHINKETLFADQFLFTVADLIEQTEGVECRKDRGVVDEIPAAYKPIDEVMNNQQDLVEIVATLKQVICVKG